MCVPVDVRVCEGVFQWLCVRVSVCARGFRCVLVCVCGCCVFLGTRVCVCMLVCVGARGFVCACVRVCFVRVPLCCVADKFLFA